MTPTEEFSLAQKYIKQGNYKEARRILMKFPDNEVASKLLIKIQSTELKERIRERSQQKKQSQNSSGLKWGLLFIVGLLGILIITLALFFLPEQYAEPENEIAMTITAMSTLPADHATIIAATETSFASRLAQLQGVSTVWLANLSFDADGHPLVYAEIRLDKDSDMNSMARDIKDLTAGILGTNQFTGFGLLLDDGINYVIYTFNFNSNAWRIEAMEAYSATRAVNASATERARPTRTPHPTRTPERALVSSTCVCDRGDILDCSNFSNHTDAQSCHNRCLREVGYDVHNLSPDGDGLACEMFR